MMLWITGSSPFLTCGYAPASRPATHPVGVREARERVSQSSTLDLESLWRESLDDVVRTVASPAQRQWLAATRPVGFSDDTVILATPHAFAREWLDTKCGDRIRDALSRAADRDLTVVITVQPKPEPVDDVGEARSVVTTPPLDAPTDGPSAPEADDHPGAPSERLGELDRQELPRERGGELTPPPLHEQIAHPVSSPDDDRPLEAPGRPPGPTVSMPSPSAPATSPTGEAEPVSDLNDKYNFDDFVIGASNRFAYAAAAAVAESPAKSYNPLFIYGGAGLGKTHLLHAIGNYVTSLYPRLKVRYVTTEQFTNEFINAIRDDRIPSFQRLYRQADILLIDDIQFLESKERTQEEFFHTFNALHNAEKQIVISSDRPPKQIARLEDRLRSRFEWGLMTDIQPPDLETRIAILQKKNEKDGLAVPPDVLELIASKVQSNIRELEGALIRVAAFASLQQAPPDLQMSEMVLKDLFPNDREQEVTTPMIMEEVAEFFNLTLDDLCSPSRSRQLVTARQIAMYLVREMTDLSLPRIGKHFGGRDHTTVMHANNKIATLMQERRTIYDQVQELTNRIKTRARSA
jgi:chromosomal replication initiator protein